MSHLRSLAVALAAAAVLPFASAQPPAAHPASAASAFASYRPWQETPRGDWRALNDAVGATPSHGHAGHAPAADVPGSASGHGGHAGHAPATSAAAPSDVPLPAPRASQRGRSDQARPGPDRRESRSARDPTDAVAPPPRPDGDGHHGRSGTAGAAADAAPHGHHRRPGLAGTAADAAPHDHHRRSGLAGAAADATPHGHHRRPGPAGAATRPAPHDHRGHAGAAGRASSPDPHAHHPPDPHARHRVATPARSASGAAR